MSSGERKYSVHEIEEILRKAVEGDGVEDLAGSDGVSLTELKAIGAEVGIDPQRIEGAAHSLTAPPEGRVNPLVGGATAFDHEVHIPGEIPADRMHEVVALIRRIMGKPGKVSELHGTLEWRADGEMGSRWVTVSTHHGHTTIRASARLGQGAALSFCPTAIGGAMAVIPVLNALSADGNPLALALIPVDPVDLRDHSGRVVKPRSKRSASAPTARGGDRSAGGAARRGPVSRDLRGGG